MNSFRKKSVSLHLGRECYPRGNCVASELGREQNAGQKKLPFYFLKIFVSASAMIAGGAGRRWACRRGRVGGWAGGRL